MAVGSIETVTQPMWILDAESKRIVQKPISYVSGFASPVLPSDPSPCSTEADAMPCFSSCQVPGLYKIFDEIIVNASDNKQRDPSMDTIKVEINQVSHHDHIS